jgi:hypothetical protein
MDFLIWVIRILDWRYSVVIGAKRGKLSPVGKESKGVKLEFGDSEEKMRSS